jgi:hypothetical protein
MTEICPNWHVQLEHRDSTPKVTITMSDPYDDQRRFQRIPVQRAKTKDKMQSALENQATCIRIPKNIVTEARQIAAPEHVGPIKAVRQFMSSLLR